MHGNRKLPILLPPTRTACLLPPHLVTIHNHISSCSPSQRTLPYTGHTSCPGSHRWHLLFLPNAWHPLVPLPYQAVPLSFHPSDRNIFSSVNSVTCVLSSFPCISVYPSSYDRDPCGVFLGAHNSNSRFGLAVKLIWASCMPSDISKFIMFYLRFSSD